MIFMKWCKYYFHNLTAITLQLLYNLFHYSIIIDAPFTLLVIMIYTTTITLSQLSSSQEGQLKNCKMKHLTRTVSLHNLPQCPSNTKFRLIKRRRYIPQKYSFTRYQSIVTLLGVALPQLFISCAAI